MWMTVRQYAEASGVSTQTVRSKIKNGKLHTKKDAKGVILVDDGSPEPVEQEPKTDERNNYSQSALESRWDVENELKRQKILNIQADIVIKRQKTREYRERLRTEFCEGVLEAYTDAFADLKGVVVDLKLKKEQIKRYKEVYGKCLKKFEQKLVQYLRKKDEDEEKEQVEEGK